jgi:hypothetical protein
MNKMMVKRALGLVVMAAALFVPAVAFADNTAPNPEGKVYTTKVVNIVGHRQMPSVVIEIARLSAAKEAGAAHETLRNALIEQSMPAALRPQR